MSTSTVVATNVLDTETPYFAFLSYRSSDGQLARWLHARLEKYRVPRALVGAKGTLGVVPRRLFPIFRDRDDAHVAGDLETILAQELSKSAQLIVVCSPEAAAPASWVNREIEIYRQRRPGALVHAVIAHGEPPECFPAPLLTPVTATTLRQPLAADLRPKRLGGKDGRQRALIKLVAALIGVQFDELWRRERRRWWMRFGIASTALFMLGSAIAFAFHQVSAVSDSRRLATHAINLTQREFDLALLLAADAFSTSATEEAEESLFHVVLAQPQFREFMQPGTKVAMSPDGKLLAIGDAKGSVNVHTAPSHALLASFAGNGKDAIRGLRFSGDGARLVSLNEAGDIRILDVATKRVERHLQAGFSGFMKLAFDYDSSNTFGTAHATGGFASPACPLALSRDGRHLAFVGKDGILQVADANTGVTLHQLGPLRKNDLRPESLVFNAEGTALAVATPDTVEIWTLHGEGSPPTQRFVPTKAADIAFMDAGILAILGEDGRLTGVGVRDGQLVFQVDAHVSRNTYGLGEIGALLAWASTARTLVTTSTEGEIALWRYPDIAACSGAGCSPTMRFSRVKGGHLSSLAVSDDAASIATAANEGSVERYATVGNDELVQPVLEMPQASIVAAASAVPATAFGDGEQVLVKSHGGLLTLKVPAQCKPTTELVLSSDARWLAAASGSAVCVKDLHEAIEIWRRPLALHVSGIALSERLLFNHDGSLLATRYRPVSENDASSDDFGTVLWNLRETNGRPHTLPGVAAVGFSDADTLVVREQNGNVDEIDAFTGRARTRYGEQLGAATDGWSYSQRDNVLYTAGNPGLIVRTDLKTQRSEEFFQRANRPAGEYLQPAVSPDGKRIAIGNANGEISLWTRDGRRLGGSIALSGLYKGIDRLLFADGHNELLLQRKDGHIVRIDLRPNHWAALARDRASRRLSDYERSRYIRSAFRPAPGNLLLPKKILSTTPADRLNACFIRNPGADNFLSEHRMFVPLQCDEKLRGVVSLLRERAGSVRDNRICTLYSEALTTLPALLSDAQADWAMRALQRHDVRSADAMVLLGLSGNAAHLSFLNALRRDDFTDEEWAMREWATAFLARQRHGAGTNMLAEQASSVQPVDLVALPACSRTKVIAMLAGAPTAMLAWPRLRQATIPRPSVGAYMQLTRKNVTAAFSLMAELMMEERNYDAARIVIAKALAQSPTDPGALNMAGLIELRSDRCAVALDYFRRSAAAGRRDGWPQYNTAVCLNRMGRLAQARAAYAAAASGNVQARSEKERALFLQRYASFIFSHHRSEDELELAAAYATDAVRITAERDGEALATLASIQSAQGDVNDAVETLRKAIYLDEREGKSTEQLRQQIADLTSAGHMR